MTPSAAELDALADYGTATLGEVSTGRRILDNALGLLWPGTAFAGTARTVACRPGDNLAIHRGIAQLNAGDVLVVDYGASLDSGPFGEIMALACRKRGARGLVIDGAVRDAAAIRRMGFSVCCRGTAIPGTLKADGGRLDVPLCVGGARIGPGDVVVADDDAVIVLAAEAIEAALVASAERAEMEAAIMARVQAGETTLDILGPTWRGTA